MDEQHRFGVAQRAKLWRKAKKPPHILIMTATPIPRTLAMTLYGDLDVSLLDEMPAGRKPIKTVHRKDNDRLGVFKFIKDEIAKGRQAYVVYPLIEESETLDYKDLMDGYESISRSFPLPDYAVSIVHGQMKAADKDYEMQRFVKGETDIMVATTVIEVGVNVPNASIMVIESAEKFGLSQLHQLRGRVGRGAEQSYCILMTADGLNENAYTRIRTMCETNDGFRIAEVDLELRGPGNVMGTQQSGMLDFKIADLNKDKPIFHAAKTAATWLMQIDANLALVENQNIKIFFDAFHKKQMKWANISWEENGQKNLVLAAIENYTDDVDSTLATSLMALYTNEIDQTYIAFTGSATVGSATSFLNANSNYVRIDGPTVLLNISW